MSPQDIYNIIMILAAIILWVVRWPKTKNYQIYAFNEVRKVYFVLFVILIVVFSLYLNFLMGLKVGSVESSRALIAVDTNGVEYKSTDPVDTTKEGDLEFEITYEQTYPYVYEDPNGEVLDDLNQRYDASNGMLSLNDEGNTIYIDPNGPYLDDNDELYTSDTGVAIKDFDKAGNYDLEPVTTNLIIHVIDATEYAANPKDYKNVKTKFESQYDKYSPTYYAKYSEVYLPTTASDTMLFRVLQSSEIGISTSIQNDYDEVAEIIQTREAMILPFPFATIPTAILLASMFYHFIFFSKAVVKAYLDELYNINKFCGFLSYNMSYRANARVLVEDTLSSIDDGQFKDDFALIFFEKDRTMQEKIADISNIYSFKFLEMFLGIAAIVFVEGPSDSTTKSLQIIQGLGDDYFIQADLFFRTKQGSMSQLQMIIIISAAIPAMVKVNIGPMLVYYINTGVGIMVTGGFYVLVLLIFVLVHRMYMDNKIIRKEGRYV